MKNQPAPEPPRTLAGLADDLAVSMEAIKTLAARLGIEEPMSNHDAARIAATLADEAQAELARLRAMTPPTPLGQIVVAASRCWTPRHVEGTR